MATKSKLERAIEERISGFNDAQRELVLSLFAAYKKNKARLLQIEDELSKCNMQASLQPEKVQLVQRASLVSEKSMLIETNSTIASRLFDLLKDEPTEEQR